MTTTFKNILLCEDDANLASVIIEYLRANDFSVDYATNGQEGLEAALNKTYDLCISDISMPQKDGLSMTAELRESGRQLPIILVSERGEKEDIIAGYKAGCDDYVTKPFSMDILICKIKAFLRRSQIDDNNLETIFTIGDTTFDSVRQLLGDKRLSSRENDLLLMLCRKQNSVVERSQILKALWQADNYFASRSLAVYINHLRHLMNDIKGVRIIAVHGKGYKLVSDSSTSTKSK